MVTITTEIKITELNLTVDHLNLCFNINFRIPDSITLIEAQFLTYFLSYYKTDLSTKLNSIPYQHIKCRSLNQILRCFILLCSKDEYLFESATNYTFRASMLLDNVHSVITQLSEPKTVISWDGCRF